MSASVDRQPWVGQQVGDGVVFVKVGDRRERSLVGLVCLAGSWVHLSAETGERLSFPATQVNSVQWR